MSTFIDGVNQVLRREGIIRGDDDVLTTFTDTTHNATSQLAQLAIQDELSDLIANELLAYEHSTSTITLATGTRSYALPADFVSLWGDPPFLYDSTNNIEYYEYPGGENDLRRTYYDYKTVTGSVLFWYLEKSTTKKISFWQVPDSGLNGRVLSFDYNANVNVTNTSDTMPFQTTNEFNQFCGMAALRFRYMYREQNTNGLDADPQYKKFRATLISLMKGKQSPRRYGSVYFTPNT